MRKYIFSIFMAATVAAQALVVRPEAAGQLAELVDGPEGVTELTVSGPINVPDIVFITENMPSLRTLDLGEASIAAYTGPRVGGLTAWPASYMPAGAFAGSSLTSVTLPAAGVLLGDAMFASSAIESFTLPAAYKEVPAGMFSDCKALRSVEFTAPVAIDDHAFAGCTALAHVKGSQNITSIGDRAFAGCTALTEFVPGASLTSIGNEAFRGAGLTAVDLAHATSLNSVGEWAFASMPSLTGADLGNCAKIGRGVLFGCAALKSASYNATEVPDYAFAGDTAHDGVLAPGTTTLGRYAMSGMSGVTDIDLPESLEKLDDHAMEHMTGLKNINVSGNTVPALGEDVWHGVNQPVVNLNVLSGMTDEYKHAEQWQNFNIVSQSLSADAVADAGASGVRARFVGDVLQVRSANSAIAGLAVYDPAGNCLALLSPDADSVDVDCSAHTTRMYIVYVRLSDGTEAAVKLAR